MMQLRQDRRALWPAAVLPLAFWCATTGFVGIMGPSNFAFCLLLVPPFVASLLFGGSRRTRKAQSPGIVAALVIGLVLLNLSLPWLVLASRVGEGEPGLSRWDEFRLTMLRVGFADVFGLMGGYFGRQFGRGAIYPDEAGTQAW